MVSQGKLFFSILIPICCFFACTDHRTVALEKLGALQQKIHPCWPTESQTFIIPDKDYLAEELGQALAWQAELQTIPIAHIPLALQGRRDSLFHICNRTIDQLAKQEVYRWKASAYDVGPILQDTSQQDIEQLQSILRRIPTFYQVAQVNLDSIHLEEFNQCIRLNIATFRWLTNLEKTASLHQDAYQAKLAIKDFIAFCHSKIFDHYDAIENDYTK